MVSVPGGGVSEGDRLSFQGSELIETRGESVVVDVDQVCRGAIQDEGGVRDGVSQ